MTSLPNSLRYSVIAALLTGTCFAGHEASSKSANSPLERGHRPIALTLEARTVESDAAVGMHLTTPLFVNTTSTILIEGYGFEGEGELGIIGAGLVYRRNVGKRGTVEASAFFEGLRSTDGFTYPQFGAGLGYSPDRWITLRANGYLPLKGKDTQNTRTERWSETEGSGTDRRTTNFSRQSYTERAPMRGFDVEVEFRLPEPPRWVDPRLAVGYAFRDAEDRPEVYSGLTTRAELRFGKHWVIEGEWRQDMAGVAQEWRAGVRFEILFGGPEERETGQSVASTGKNFVPLEAPADRDRRADERYMPVKRFPWPTLARGVTHGNTTQGYVKPVSQPAAAPKAADDCCPSGSSPLIFN